MASVEPRWLSIVGLSEDGFEGLSPAARRIVSQAELIVGGKRHLGLIGEVPAKKLAWPSPPAAAFPTILARRGTPVCVLASGDPFFFGIGSLLAQRVPPSEFVCLPSPSAFSLAAARLGWALQDCALVSLHGRALPRIVPHLQPAARILALSWDETTPAKLAHFLTSRGLGQSRLTICEAMGGPRERLRSALAAEFALDTIEPLNTIAVEVAGDDSRLMPLVPGLPDDWFESDGQITKREIRALTLSSLAPRRGELLWDVGAGSGSIAIEWMLRHAANRAIAIEAKGPRADRIARNAASLGVPDLRIVAAKAPCAFVGLPVPDAIFVGGGGSNDGVLDAVMAALRPGGRLVVNAVTIETQAELGRRFTAHQGELVQISIAHARPLGGLQGWRPAMPVMQWTWVKP